MTGLRGLGWRRGVPPGGADQALFRRARLHLTVWYVCTLMVIVIGFSAVIYGILARALPGHHHDGHELASERAAERETADFALGQLRFYLLLGNAGLLVLGSAGAYLLAGRTLRPIADALARQRRFTADASHELRTPLTAMRGTIDVALQRRRPASDYRAVLQEVGEEVEGMSLLVEHLLRLARGAPPPVPTALDLSSLLAELERSQRPLAAERGSTLLIDAGASAAVCADRTAVRTVLGNLVGNALQHTPPGTVVRVSTADEDGGVAIRVIDNGPGIPADERDSVFRPFYRLSTTGADGHGIGLALARELVIVAGGRIAIDETPGGGTTVRVWFKRDTEAPATATVQSV